MVSRKKPDPYLIDFETAPLTEEEVKGLMPAREFFEKFGKPAGPGRPVKGAGKQQVTIRLDRDIIQFFRSQGPGWQTRLNDELAEVVRRRQTSR